MFVEIYIYIYIISHMSRSVSYISCFIYIYTHRHIHTYTHIDLKKERCQSSEIPRNVFVFSFTVVLVKGPSPPLEHHSV